MDEGIKIPIIIEGDQAFIQLKDIADAAKRSTDGLDNASNSFKKLAGATGTANIALINTGRVVQDLPYGFIGIANNINPLIESFQRLQAESRATGTSLTSNLKNALLGGGGLGIAVSVLTTGILLLTNGFSNFSRKANEAKQKAQEFDATIKSITHNAAEEVARVDVLVEAIKRETTTRQQRINAIKELQSIAPQYFATLNTEKATVEDVTKAYNLFNNNITRSIEARVLSKQLEVLVEQRIELDKLLKISDEYEVVNGKIVIHRNALYATEEQLNELQDKRNKLKIEEERITKRIVSLQPPKSIFSADNKINAPEVKAKEKVFELDGVLRFKRIELIPLDDAALKEAEKAFQERARQLPQLAESALPKHLEDAVIPGLDKILEKMQQLQAMAQIIGQGIANAFGNAFDAILNGKNAIQALGSAVKQLVIDLIKAAIQSLVLKTITGALFPGSAALSFGTHSLPHFASGGIVSGPTLGLIGEGVGTSASNPEVIAPLNQLKSFFGELIGNRSFNAGVGRNVSAAPVVINMPSSVRLYAEGRDLVGVIALQSASEGRTG